MGVDRDHRGRAPVEAIVFVVVAGELDAVASAELLFHLGEGIGIGGAAVAGDRLSACPSESNSRTVPASASMDSTR